MGASEEDFPKAGGAMKKGGGGGGWKEKPNDSQGEELAFGPKIVKNTGPTYENIPYWSLGSARYLKLFSGFIDIIAL